MSSVNKQKSEIVTGITLIKTETEFTGNFEALDQINTYTVDSKLAKDVELMVDISGSTGAAFEGSVNSLTKQACVKAYGTADVARVKLFGEWDLKIRFTYNILDVPLE
jgi:hypothetical protein